MNDDKSPTVKGNVMCMDCRCGGWGCPGMPRGFEQRLMDDMGKPHLKGGPGMSDDLVKRLRAVVPTVYDAHDAADEIERLQARVTELANLDCEAATHVESVIAMRTGFTGDPPYVGWRGLGLALNEALDARDAAEAKLATAVEALQTIDDVIEAKSELFTSDLDLLDNLQDRIRTAIADLKEKKTND